MNPCPKCGSIPVKVWRPDGSFQQRTECQCGRKTRWVMCGHDAHADALDDEVNRKQMTIISVRDHIKGSPAGYDVVALADKVGVPISLDLLKLPPHEARVELAHRIARKLCEK